MVRLKLAVVLGGICVALTLAACGGSGGSDSASAATAVAKCFEKEGGEVTRRRNEISAGYEEIAAVAKKDRGIVRVYLIKQPKDASSIAEQIEFELEEIKGLGLGLVKPVAGGKIVTAVFPINREAALHPETALAVFPSKADEKLVAKCAEAAA